jgi:hypothetical protein
MASPLGGSQGQAASVPTDSTGPVCLSRASRLPPVFSRLIPPVAISPILQKLDKKG